MQTLGKKTAKYHQKWDAATAEFTSADQWRSLIQHPGSQYSEFEVQSYLYWSLRSLGHDARGEVMVRAGRCRFDILVFVDFAPKFIIEVKKKHGIPITGVRAARFGLKKKLREQNEKYALFGLPVLKICAMAEARAFIESVRQLGHIPSPDGGFIPPNSHRPIKPASRLIHGADESTGTDLHSAGRSMSSNCMGNGAHAPQVNSTTEKATALQL